MKAPAIIARKFQIERLLGQGGMGHVYLARDPRLGNRRVAIKLLQVDSEEARHRFEQEAASAANLHHRNIVVIYEYGDHEGQPYIAMEFIEGDPLSTIIVQRRPLSLGRKLDLLDDLCAGLGFAHQQGIVHRDVKPGNLLLDRDGCLKIVDFGIARAHAGSRFTVGTIGTPNYMSPEQVNGDPVDQRSDIFAVGLVAYELLSYRMAFPGDSGRVYDLIRYREPESLNAIVADCDARLIGLVQRAIAKRPLDRYQNLDELRSDLEAVRRTAGAAAQKAAAGPLDTVIQRRPMTPQPNALDRAALARRRQRIVDEQLEAGRIALDAGDLEGAVDRFEQAAALDESNPQAIEMLELARARLTDQQVGELLQQAETSLSRTQLDEASELVDRALALKPDDERAAAVGQAVEKARAVARALDLARQHLANNAADAALRAASDALALDPSNTDALELTQRAFEVIAETQRQARRRQQVHEALTRARGLANAGQLEAAIPVLQAVTPPDESTTALLSELQAKLDESRRRIAAEEAQAAQRAAAEAESARRERETQAAQRAAAETEAARRAQEQESARRLQDEAAQRVREAESQRARAAEIQHARDAEAAQRAVAAAEAERLAREAEAQRVRQAESQGAREAEHQRAREAESQRARDAAAQLAREADARRARDEETARLAREEQERQERKAAAAALPVVVPAAAAAPMSAAAPQSQPRAARAVEPQRAAPAPSTKKPVALAVAGALLVVILGAAYVFTRPAPAVVSTRDAGKKTPPLDVTSPVVDKTQPTEVVAPPDLKKEPVVPPVGADPRLAAAKTAFEQRHFSTAVRIYEEILTATPGDTKVTAALTDARTARTRQARAVTDLLAKGDAQLRERAYAQAIASFGAALAEDPDNRQATDKVRDAKAAQQRADAAAAEILGQPKTVGPVAPDPRATLMKQANALLAAGLLDDAIASFDSVLNTHPGDAEAKAGRDAATRLKTAAQPR